MPTTTDRPSVDVGALSGELHGAAMDAMAATLIVAFDHLEEDDNPLNQLQRVELVREALLISANLEAMFARTIINDLERNGVATWGLDSDLERLLGKGAGT